MGLGGLMGGAHRFVGNVADCGLEFFPEGAIMQARYPAMAADDRCSVCQRISDLEEGLRIVTVTNENLVSRAGGLGRPDGHHTIDWDDDSGINNRGSDGWGLIASCVIHGVQERIVQLNFTYYAEGDDSIGDLTALCQDISDMIHERLD